MDSSKNDKGKYTSFLFIGLLFFALALCSLFTILIGAQVYENINERMEENFMGQTGLSYISNKVKQADSIGAVSVKNVEGVEVLALEQTFEANDTVYETLIYYKDGQICELFAEPGLGLGLSDGIPIMSSKGISFKQITDKLIQVKMEDTEGGTMLLGLRSEGNK